MRLVCAGQKVGLLWEEKDSGEPEEARGLCLEEIQMTMNYLRRTEKTPMRSRKEGHFQLRGQHERKRQRYEYMVHSRSSGPLRGRQMFKGENP